MTSMGTSPNLNVPCLYVNLWQLESRRKRLCRGARFHTGWNRMPRATIRQGIYSHFTKRATWQRRGVLGELPDRRSNFDSGGQFMLPASAGGTLIPYGMQLACRAQGGDHLVQIPLRVLGHAQIG